MLKLLLAVAVVLLATMHSVNGEMSLAAVEMEGIFDLVKRFFPKDKNNNIGGCKKGACVEGATFHLPGSNEPLVSPLGRPDMTGIEDENGNKWQEDSKKADGGAASTAAPVTAAPVTAAPVTAAPVTAAPATEAPALTAADAEQPLDGADQLATSGSSSSSSEDAGNGASLDNYDF